MTISFNPSQVSCETGAHIICFPAMSLKDVPADDPDYLKEIYAKVPGANYYKTHAASATARGKPGTCTIHSSDNGGVINMFTRLYSGNRTLANDNHGLRVKHFKQCLDQLLSGTFETLHFTFPSVLTDLELKEYTQAIEDYWATYKLNHKTDLNIVVHNYEPKGRVQILKKSSSQEDTQDFELDVSPDQINEQTLYEVDFISYILKAADSSPACELEPEIFKYFPKDVRFKFIVNDPELKTLAHAIPMDKVVADNVYPPPENMFNAFGYMKCEPKVVLLGQDPYHRKGQAHGLSFSVQAGVAIPPSLRNVYKALTNDIPGFVAPKHGTLTAWAEQGVLLLNTALTVEEGQPASHLQIWEAFTDRIVTLLSKQYPDLVFMLWGTKSKAKKRFITGKTHLILECQHPSPQIANNTFDKDCNHFSQANAWLKKHGKQEISW